MGNQEKKVSRQTLEKRAQEMAKKVGHAWEADKTNIIRDELVRQHEQLGYQIV